MIADSANHTMSGGAMGSLRDQVSDAWRGPLSREPSRIDEDGHLIDLDKRTVQISALVSRFRLYGLRYLTDNDAFWCAIANN